MPGLRQAACDIATRGPRGPRATGTTTVDMIIANTYSGKIFGRKIGELMEMRVLHASQRQLTMSYFDHPGRKDASRIFSSSKGFPKDERSQLF